MFDPETPYNQLPPLPPNCELGTPATLRANIGEAVRLVCLQCAVL